MLATWRQQQGRRRVVLQQHSAVLSSSSSCKIRSTTLRRSSNIPLHSTRNYSYTRNQVAVIRSTNTTRLCRRKSATATTTTTTTPKQPPQQAQLDESKYAVTFSDVFHANMEDSTGSLARDLMALERTYLAWVRTSFVLFGLGVALSEYKKYVTGRYKAEEERAARKMRWKEKNHQLKEELQHLHPNQPHTTPAMQPTSPKQDGLSSNQKKDTLVNLLIHKLEDYHSVLVIMAGQILLISSTIRYFRTVKAIKLGKYPTNKLQVLFMSLLTASASLVSLWYISEAGDEIAHHLQQTQHPHPQGNTGVVPPLPTQSN